MRIFPKKALAFVSITLGLLLVGNPPASHAQEASLLQDQEGSLLHRQILGLQDAQTGAFHPFTTLVPEPVTAPVTGTITLTLHITLKTAVPTGGKVLCGAIVSASYSGLLGTATYGETDYVTGVVSGSTATCTLAIPHSWQFPPVTATDVESLFGNYTADIVNPGATSPVQLQLSRSSTSSFVALSGANIFATAPTTFSMNVTL